MYPATVAQLATPVSHEHSAQQKRTRRNWLARRRPECRPARRGQGPGLPFLPPAKHDPPPDANCARGWVPATRSRYFLFLRWIRVFFSSLRCFFFAILLRRFLMTEPIRPPPSSAQRQTGTPSRSPRDGRAGHTPENCRDCASDYRSRSPLAYPLPPSGVTARSSFGVTRRTATVRRPGAGRAWRLAPGCRTSRIERPAEHVPPVLRRFRSPRSQQPAAVVSRCLRTRPADTG